LKRVTFVKEFGKRRCGHLFIFYRVVQRCTYVGNGWRREGKGVVRTWREEGRGRGQVLQI